MTSSNNLLYVDVQVICDILFHHFDYPGISVLVSLTYFIRARWLSRIHSPCVLLLVDPNSLAVHLILCYLNFRLYAVHIDVCIYHVTQCFVMPVERRVLTYLIECKWKQWRPSSGGSRTVLVHLSMNNLSSSIAKIIPTKCN